MASPSRNPSTGSGQKKDGLRCKCGRLLLEKDPKMGFGVRCGRDNCREFHTLGEINQRAAEFENKKGGWMPEKKTILEILNDKLPLLFRLRDSGFVVSHKGKAVGVKRVKLYFSHDGSDCEVQDFEKDWHRDYDSGKLIGNYRTCLDPLNLNEKIRKRLSQEEKVFRIFLYLESDIILSIS